MTYRLIVSPRAVAEIEFFKRSNPAAYSKIQRLFAELRMHPRTGTGNPEPLCGDRARQWSRRITQKHRLVYSINDDMVVVSVLSAAKHYDDK